ncbi:helix-turn-helix domain-containing protein [Terriglobus aquaticus]|uniref:Helix-turn-helix domain-containing protein n=1 Tax=Terriglobus aquaticus TaxID=940139 RepID=A0ABW9KI11_9BACT|nr:helix-turn-helix domain-containing protein [Terriglobus aquaticus]
MNALKDAPDARTSLVDSIRQFDRYLTTREVMNLLQLGRNTICGWCASGRLPALRTPNGYRFDPIALAVWLDSRMLNGKVAK